jgi:hypothetical protein
MFKTFLAVISRNNEAENMIVTANSIEAAIQTIRRRESSLVNILSIKEVQK